MKTFRILFLAIFAAVLVVSPFSSVAWADVYVVDRGSAALYRITPAGGLSTIFSGVPFSSPRGVAVDVGGNILVADYGAGAIFKVTPTGSVSTLASGSPLVSPRGIAIEESGSILVTDEGANALFRVNPSSGAVSTVKSGAPFVTLREVAVEATGTILVADRGANALFRVDPSTSAVSTVASGAPFVGPIGLAVSPDGAIYVSDFLVPAIFKVVGSTVTTVKSGGLLTDPSGILMDPGGNLLATNGTGATLLLVSPGTGEVATVKSGAPFSIPSGIAWVPSTTNGIWSLSTGGSAGLLLQIHDLMGANDPYTVLVTIFSGLFTASPSWKFALGSMTGTGLTRFEGTLFNATVTSIGSLTLDFSAKTYSLTEGATTTSGAMVQFVRVPR